MKSLKKFGFAALATLLSMIIFTSCEETSDDKPTNPNDPAIKGDFVLEFENIFKSGEINFGTEYTTSQNEALTFNKLRYYISNIKLEKMTGTVWAEEESYHLVDHAVPSSQMISIKDVPAGEYHKISYMIGVDSARNVSGAQEGALSPANNMFWTWNTGYIFVKIEGTSPEAADNTFSYHIGGFAGEKNALETNTHMMHDHVLNINPDATPQVHIKVDIAEIFNGHHGVSVANMNKVHMPGEMAKELAHSFSEAFSLDHIHD